MQASHDLCPVGAAHTGLIGQSDATRSWHVAPGFYPRKKAVEVHGIHPTGGPSRPHRTAARSRRNAAHETPFTSTDKIKMLSSHPGAAFRGYAAPLCPQAEMWEPLQGRRPHPQNTAPAASLVPGSTEGVHNKLQFLSLEMQALT
jgi:hypothetical protein